MIDMNKPYVGFMDKGRDRGTPSTAHNHHAENYQIYIVTWPDKGPGRGPEFLAQGIGDPMCSEDSARSALESLARLTGVQNADKLSQDFFPSRSWGSVPNYTKPDGFIPRTF